MDKPNQKKFLGITTVGEKGQMVIPAEVRAAMKLAKGEKLVVMSSRENAFVVMKASRFETMASRVARHLASVRSLIKKNKK
jgi:AbrB family looped-hinge helix DNA binding protein